jgi:hypothetical protein
MRYKLTRYYAYGDGAGWIQFLNVIVQWKHAKHAPLFSERYGYRKFFDVPFTPYRIRLALARAT